jgi:NAD(P)H-nitrite reductase large subunit
MRVVVVGSGLAGATFVEALGRNLAYDICLVTDETLGYYSRPRLSHGVALDDQAAARIVMKRYEALAPAARVFAGSEAWRIDRAKHRLVLADGRRLPYEVLVLATGSAARIPPVLATSRVNFLLLNSFDDLLTLRRRRAKVLAHGKVPHWAVIGGGLIGCELASDLRKAGDAVTIFHRESRLIELQFDESHSQALHEHFIRQGIAVRYSQDVRAVTSGMVATANGESGPFDGVIVSAGFAPRIELARDAELPTARGILVDEYLRTSDPSIYALGDVAEIGGRLYPFVSPIRSQALWLAQHLEKRTAAPWQPPAFKPIAKIHGFKLDAESGLTPERTMGGENTSARFPLPLPA